MTGISEDPEPVVGALGRTGTVVTAVRTAFIASGQVWLRRIEVTVDGGAVVLRGQVPSFYLKQMALVTVQGVAGVTAVRNELKVEGGSR
jgi:osmotically-inducible protein OsmY